MGSRLEGSEHLATLLYFDLTGQHDVELLALFALDDERIAGRDAHELGETDHLDQLVVGEVSEDRDVLEDGGASLCRQGIADLVRGTSHPHHDAGGVVASAALQCPIVIKVQTDLEVLVLETFCQLVGVGIGGSMRSCNA
jgi:hypothetical protein